ncbi:MAG: hypothetical protein HY306_00630 [Nitrosomonadales bacterium]|nr:hypothetical protein [Nitrosomonadales bacterium]
MSSNNVATFASLVVLWLVIVIGAIGLRSVWPVDETRYLTIAWEMWLRGDWWVPHLNGVPYSDKPPLLFWLFHLGWAIGGVNEGWPRLVPPLAALANVALTMHLSHRLWPERPERARTTALILFGSLLWLACSTVLLFDMLLWLLLTTRVVSLPIPETLSVVPGLLLIGAGFALFRQAPSTINRQVWALTLISVTLTAVVYAGVVPAVASTHDMHPLAARLAGKYYGEYQFLGRLHRPLQVIAEDDLLPWADAHPGGRVLTYSSGACNRPDAVATTGFALEYVQAYRGGNVCLWRVLPSPFMGVAG